MADNPILLGAQRGLLMRAVFGQILTINLKAHDEATRKQLVSTICTLSENVAKQKDCGLIAAFAPALWGKWTGRSIPITTTVLGGGFKFCDTGGDVLLYVKAPNAATAERIVTSVKPHLQEVSQSIDELAVGKRPDVRIMGGRYVDSVTNPNDPISLTEDILIAGDPKYRGATFGITQKFIFDWQGISSQSPDTQDEMIGRNPEGAVLSQHTLLGHTHRAHILDSNGDQRKLLRQALPFGTAKGHAGREQGLMFVGFCNEQERFEKILQNLLGGQPDRPADRLLDVVESKGGSYWYVPAAAELGVPAVQGPDDVYEDPRWQVSSTNGYLFYNSQDYMHQMAENRYVGGDPPSARVLSLMSRTFNHWRDGWLRRQIFPRLPHLKELLPAKEHGILQDPVPIRKAMANRQTLVELLSSVSSDIAQKNELLRIEARELIVGVIPDFTLGRGKEVVPYLDEDEIITAWIKAELNEWSSMGHVVPDYELLVKKGLGDLISDLQGHLKKLPDPNGMDKKKATFYNSVVLSLQGVQGYLSNWAIIAERAAAAAGATESAQNMHDVSARLKRLVDHPPQSFQDAVQLIFSFHCCLHLVGELTAFGRLDQILWPFLQRDSISQERAQEIIDCLWIKIGENAFIDRALIYDYVSYGTTAVCGLGGNFAQGGGINQWVQQITVGGYKATDADKAEGGANLVTRLCLKAARRIPVNAPTLSLRVYKDMEADLLDEAAKSILAGGAQPILYNDDKLCEALYRSGKTVGRAWSRNYAADGCYEPMLAGASEFAFNNVAPMLALEQTINQGATYGAAGPESLRGLKQTFRSPAARDIHSFEKLQEIFLKQVEWLVIQCYNTMLNGYGNLGDICPSPLLSALIDGCAERGRDLTDGGSRFHIIAPLCVGVPNVIDSLYAIKKLVFDPETAVTTLPQLVQCLICDWGFSMIEPFQAADLGPADAAEHGLRFQELRRAALALPKWQSGNAEVNALGDWVMENLVRFCVDVIRRPHPVLASVLETIRKNYGDPDFEFVVEPGIGTFEGYVGDGAPCGASADGRRNGAPIASDLSPVPGPQDLPPTPVFRNIYQSMESCRSEATEYGMSNASPVDMNISESFPLDDLRRFVGAYARGEVGGNLITLTCADLKTYQNATADPERYNLVRVRMGGWTEFYATMFPAHQDQHQRRQYFSP
ncbi:dyp-type peroxidase family protein [Xylariales sp. PMI_506]|nr:dyp-type peroxidase family protein [Xylariales sp. PMI_506]